MVDSYLRRTPLAHLGLASQAVTAPPAGQIGLAEVVPAGQLALRGESSDKTFLEAFASGFGFDLPVEACRAIIKDDITALWFGPNEWLLCSDKTAGPALEGKAASALAECRHAITDVSESRVIIRARGEQVRTLLAKGSSINFHPNQFSVGDCPSSSLARCHATFHLRQSSNDVDCVDIYVHCSFAEYAWHWLRDAAHEIGSVVLEAG